MFNKRAVNSDMKQTHFQIKMFEEVFSSSFVLRSIKEHKTKVKEAKRKIQVGLMKKDFRALKNIKSERHKEKRK